MTYVEKMGQKIWMESPERCEEIIEQIIADTKAACIKAIKKDQDEYKSTAYTKDSYIHDIKKAEVKESAK
jgi:TRAP-type C4-dicarboxylate transport system substrate-binding protein